MSDKKNLIETIAAREELSTFSRIMGTSGANDVFAGAGGFTVLAPTNDAFAKFSDEKMDGLLTEEKQLKLKALLMYHVIPGKVMSSGLKSGKTVTGQEVMVTDINGIKVNSSALQARNLEASDGVVHAIDTVLEPSAHFGAAKPLI